MVTCWTLDWTMVGALLALTAPRMARELSEVYLKVKGLHGNGTAQNGN